MTDPNLVALLASLTGDHQLAVEIAVTVSRHFELTPTGTGYHRFNTLAEIPVGVPFRDRSGATWRIVAEGEAELVAAGSAEGPLDDLWPYDAINTPDTAAGEWECRTEWGIRPIADPSWVHAVPDWTRTEATEAAEYNSTWFGPHELVCRTVSGWSPT